MSGFCEQHLVHSNKIDILETNQREFRKELESLWKSSDNSKERVLRLEISFEQMTKVQEVMNENIKEIKFESRKLREDLEKQLSIDKKEILDKIEEGSKSKENKYLDIINGLLKVSLIAVGLAYTYGQFFAK